MCRLFSLTSLCVTVTNNPDNEDDDNDVDSDDELVILRDVSQKTKICLEESRCRFSTVMRFPSVCLYSY